MRRARDRLDVFASGAPPAATPPMDADAHAAFEERAAILEFDCGYVRAEAERIALHEVITSQQRRTV